jgi:homospermidine synthase
MDEIYDGTDELGALFDGAPKALIGGSQLSIHEARKLAPLTTPPACRWRPA